jgi:hypothetical protein
MKKLPTQLIVGLGILLIGGGIVGGEILLVKWYPSHKEAVKQKTLALTPYENDGLGIDMQIAAGLNGKTEIFIGGVRIYSPKLLGKAPTLTITSQENSNQSAEFTPQDLAIWQSYGSQHNLWRYDFEHTRIHDRDAVLIWQYKNGGMLLTARIISPDHIVEADCTPGSADENLYLQACEETVRTIKVEGPPSPPAAIPGGMELAPGTQPGKQ